MTLEFKKHLGIPALIKTVRDLFLEIPDPRKIRSDTIRLADHLMAGLAVFGLKCASLLEFDKKRFEPPTVQNLRDLYLVENVPSDTYLRERLDEVPSDALRPAFKKLFAVFQRGKGLEKFEYLDGHVLLSGDGTGHFSSNKVCCPQCCKKTNKDGTVSYYHQMFGVCVVHPDMSNVIPLCPEPILNQHNATKNDCERNACKRFLENFRIEHPHLKAILLEDGLSSNAPNIHMIQAANLKFILVAKPGDHKFLFDQMATSAAAVDHEITSADSKYHQFRYLNEVALNKSNPDLKVNFMEYRVTDAKGKELNFSWVTNIYISKTNALKIAIGGRTRWKVENETFNTLKNLGYNFEHNYGHGKQYLSTNFCMLMMLAFLMDQIQEICCVVFQKSRKRLRTYRETWETMRTLFRMIPLNSWENFYKILYTVELTPDTS